MENIRVNNGIKGMSTSFRHNDIVKTIGGHLFVLSRTNKKIEYWTDTIALVYKDYKLIDVNDVKVRDIRKVTSEINSLPFKEPDVMIFNENAYISNNRYTRMAGTPDLIVEVWSKDNNESHRKEKFKIYSSSDSTEHWYFDQDSNIIECYRGTQRLPDQHMRNILKTQSGLEFDLRELDTGEDDSWNDFVEYGFKG